MKPARVTLGHLRIGVQVFALAFLVYGGSVLGQYLSDNISGALPALSCAYDQQNADYCVLIPIQHQLNHRVGEALVRMQQFSLRVFLPLVFTLLSFMLFFVVLNKAFCGWLCPLGTLQELLYRLGRRLARPMHRISAGRLGKLRAVKWFMLLGLVFVLPLLAGLGVAPHAVGDAFCQVCPSRILTTLATGDTRQLALNTSGAGEIFFSALRSFLVGFIIIAALAVRQPFCRVCPMLALHATLRRLSLTRLVKNRQSERCGKCGICTRACPMDIHEIWKTHGRNAFHDDCTLCGRCAEYCPEDGLITIKTGPFTLFASSRDYYKQRVKLERPDGTLHRKPREVNA